MLLHMDHLRVPPLRRMGHPVAMDSKATDSRHMDMVTKDTGKGVMVNRDMASKTDIETWLPCVWGKRKIPFCGMLHRVSVSYNLEPCVH